MKFKGNVRYTYDKIIYISHPYSGKKENVELIEKKVQQLIKENPNILYVSPVHCFGYLYDAVSYEEGIDMCLALLEKCDEMWIISDFYENSKGCLIERSFAQSKGIKVYNISFE